MPFAQKVKSALWAIVDIMALHSDRFVKSPGKDFSRERKLGSPSASAFIQQRAKFLPDTFYHLFRQFNIQFAEKLFKGKYSLIAADGSEFNIARNPDDKTTFHPSSGKSKKGFNMIHTVSLFELFSKRHQYKTAS